MKEERNMTDNEITACLNAIGLLFDGTVTLTKKIGREEPDVESTRSLDFSAVFPAWKS